MTDAQWKFEAEALRRKEEAAANMQVEVVKAGARILHDTLVSVLGLGLFAPAGGSEAGAEAGGPLPFLPAAFLFANHHLLRVALEERDKSEHAGEAMGDAAFEAFSARLARGDVGDLDPLLLGTLPTGTSVDALWKQTAFEQTLAALGVKERPIDAPAAPHFGGDERRVRVDDEDEP